ncbi:MAG: hypothetical protein ABSB49_09785 [Polyangia bacterium]
MKTLASIQARLENLRRAVPPTTKPVAFVFTDEQEASAREAGAQIVRFDFLPAPSDESEVKSCR